MKIIALAILLILGFGRYAYSQSSRSQDSAAVRDFTKFMQRHLRYPIVDRENNVSGHSIVSFDVVDGEVSNLKVVKSLSATCDHEVFTQLNAYSQLKKEDALRMKSYKLDVNFVIDDAKNDQTTQKQVNLAGVIPIEIVTYPIKVHKDIVN